MTSKPPQPPQTQISRLVTQAVQTIQAQVNFSGLVLKKGVKVPELRVVDSGTEKVEAYPLLGERYIVGRSSKSCDIIIRNPVVSQVHFSLHRDRKNPRKFTIRDEQSTNGLYVGKKRVDSALLHHGDKFTLGPPELEASVTVKFYNPAPVWVSLIRYVLYGGGIASSLFALWLAYEWSKITVRPLPVSSTGPVVVYARDGQTSLSPIRSAPHRDLENLADFSPFLPQAVIASEDTRFNWHFGVDPLGIIRAIFINYQTGGVRQGASTLTQQLARSLFPQVGRENTASRKIREAIVALKLEAFYSKDEILKLYLNRVFLGVTNYGFEDAAQFYFDKSAADLTLNEAATLVAILPAPNSFNPVNDYDTAIQLRNRVIMRMVQQGMISETEAKRARRSPIEVSPKARQSFASTIAPHFYSYVFTELRQVLGSELAKEGNFIVETGLDPNIQAQAEKSLRNAVATNGSTFRFSEGAIVTLNTRTGEIIAMVGGTDYAKSQFNRATQAQRQPGSTFKVFAYAAALERGISPFKTYSCAGLRWQGQNYRPCERSSGNIDMFRGLAQSENSVALRVARDAGLGNVANMAKRLGINSELKTVPGLVIGQSEVNVLEITGSYAAFANNGVWNRPHAIRRVLDGSDCTDFDDPQTCRVIYDFSKDRNGTKRVISTQLANTMTRLLRGVVQAGTGGRASIGFDEAGKTGTTDRGVDLWFIGYVPSRQIVTGIWLGNDDNSPTRGSSGQAATLWGNYMKTIIR